MRTCFFAMRGMCYSSLSHHFGHVSINFNLFLRGMEKYATLPLIAFFSAIDRAAQIICSFYIWDWLKKKKKKTAMPNLYSFYVFGILMHKSIPHQQTIHSTRT